RHDTRPRAQPGIWLPRRTVEASEAEVPEAEARSWTPDMRLAQTGRVDQVRDPVLQTVQHLRLLRLGQTPGCHGLVELLLGRSDQRVDQPVDRLAVVLRHLGEALPVPVLGLELSFR